MAATKGGGTTVIASTTSTTTSSAQTGAATDYATEAYISIVVVGTPTGAASVQIEVSPDTGTTYYSPPVLLFTTNLLAGTYVWTVLIPPTANAWKAIFTAQTGGTSSTCVVQSNDVTGI